MSFGILALGFPVSEVLEVSQPLGADSLTFFPIFMHSLGDVWHPGSGVPYFAGFNFALGPLGPHNFTLISHSSPTRVSHSGCLGLHEFTLVSPLSPTLGGLGRMSLHLSPTLVSHTCLPHLSPTCPSHLGALGRMILHLSPTRLPHVSPTLDVLGRMSLHLSPTCIPHLSPTLVSGIANQKTVRQNKNGGVFHATPARHRPVGFYKINRMHVADVCAAGSPNKCQNVDHSAVSWASLASTLVVLDSGDTSWINMINFG